MRHCKLWTPSYLDMASDYDYIYTPYLGEEDGQEPGKEDEQVPGE